MVTHPTPHPISTENEALRDFIEKRKVLVWYVKNPRGLSEEAIVEAVLNYGNWEDVQELFRILSIQKVAAIFRQQIIMPRQRGNYYADVVNYFTLYFNKYV
jgi:hypothetical protein